MNKYILFVLGALVCLSCAQEKTRIDKIVKADKIYTVDNEFTVAEAMAIDGDKVIAVGSVKDIEDKYSAKAKERYNGIIYPGFIDAHAHFFGYGKTLQIANLREAASYDEIVSRVKAFADTHPEGWIVGRGWDQNDWPVKSFPTNDKLNELFPNRPVYLTRIDGHAALVNDKALEIAGYTTKTKISGGDLLQKNGKLTGVLIDNAKDKMASFMPSATRKQAERILKDAEKDCFALGLTTIVDAGLDADLVEQIDSLQQSGELKMRLQVMLSLSDDNMNYLKNKGQIKTERLFVNGFKAYADGALGSRGALLIDDYHDHKGHKGLLIMDTIKFRKHLAEAYEHNFQMNTHAIGDDANRILLDMYGDFLKGENDRRWRIEHAQVVDENDFNLFGKYNIVPSVQPTHATSDMYWAEERLGADRIKNAYAYKELLDQNGWIPLGTDFPIEEVDPMLTYYAAVVRKDKKAYPAGGYQTENALSREEALRGMTIWAAKGSFQEEEKGSLEAGKYADYIVLSQDIMTVEDAKLLETKVLNTIVGGEEVFRSK